MRYESATTIYIFFIEKNNRRRAFHNFVKMNYSILKMRTDIATTPSKFIARDMYDKIRSDLIDKLLTKSMRCYCAGCVGDTSGHLGTAPVQFIEKDKHDDPDKCCCFNCVIADPSDEELENMNSSDRKKIFREPRQYFAYKYTENHELSEYCIYQDGLYKYYDIITFDNEITTITCCCIDCMAYEYPKSFYKPDNENPDLIKIYNSFWSGDGKRYPYDSERSEEMQTDHISCTYKELTRTRFSILIPEGAWKYRKLPQIKFKFQPPYLKYRQLGFNRYIFLPNDVKDFIAYNEKIFRFVKKVAEEASHDTLSRRDRKLVNYYREWHGYKVIGTTIVDPPTPTCEGRAAEIIIAYRGISNKDIINKHTPAERARIFQVLSNWCYGCEKYSGCCSCARDAIDWDNISTVAQLKMYLDCIL